MAVDLFLVLQNGGKNICQGETLDATYSANGAVELQSFTLKSNIDLSDTDSAASDEQKKVFTLSIKKAVDNASPDLFRAYCMHATKQEKAFDTGTLSVRKSAGSGGLEYLTFQLGNVTIQSYKLDAADGDKLPEENIDLAFGTLQVTYYPQKSAGSAGTMISAGWDFGGNASM